MTNTPKENKKNNLNIRRNVTTIFVTLLVIAIIFFIIKSTSQKKLESLPVNQYKSFTQSKQINDDKKPIEKLNNISSEGINKKNITVAFSQLLNTPPVNDIKIDQYKRVWVATEKGVYKIENDELTAFTVENGKYPFAQANCIEFDGKNIWIGSLFGICVYNEKGKFINQNSNFSLPSNIVWDILWDGEQLWVATQNGIAFYKSLIIDNILNGIYFDKNNEENKTKFLDNKNTNNGLRSSWGTKIARYYNWLAVIHDNGLSLLNLAFPAADPRSWKNIDHAKSYMSRPIHDIIFDSKNIWLGTPKGLMMINTPLKDFESRFSTEMVSFLKLHGLPSNNINSMAYFKNTIWLGTDNGLAKLRNNQIQIVSDISGKKPQKIRKLAIQGDTDNIILLWIGTDSGVQFINTQMAD